MRMSSRLNRNSKGKRNSNKGHVRPSWHVKDNIAAKSFALSSTAFSVCLALSSVTLPAIINPAYANGPKGGVIVDGSGDISKVDRTTIITQTSQNMAINEKR